MSLKAKGGITKGKSHAEGGMPMVVKSTGQKVELEGGEGVINKKNMADTQKHEFEGKMLTKCEIASEINSDGGNGVEIDCDGIVGKKYKHQDGGRLAEGGKVEYNYFEVENNENGEISKTYERTNVASPNIPNAKKISKKEYEKSIYSENDSYEFGGLLNMKDIYFNWDVWLVRNEVYTKDILGDGTFKRATYPESKFYVYSKNGAKNLINTFKSKNIKPKGVIDESFMKRIEYKFESKDGNGYTIVIIEPTQLRKFVDSEDLGTLTNDYFTFERKNYAKGGSMKRNANSPLLKYVNFEDGWSINLKKLNLYTNQNGKKYKSKNKYGISRQGGKNKDIWEFETLNEAKIKYDELVELGKTYSKIRNQGDVDKNYAKGGDVKEKYEVYIDFMNRDKNFATDRKYFKTYEDAERWAKKEFDSFNPDMISYTYAEGGEIKVGTKVKYPKAKMIGEIVSIENDSAIPNEKSVKVRYKDGKEVTDLLSSFEVVSTYAEGGNVKFRKLAKSKNFDIVTDEGRYEIEMGAFDIPKNIIDGDTRKEINTHPIAKKYRSEIQKYLDDNYAKGGDIDGFDEIWNRFKENTREAFGQPRNNNIVRLESDFGFKKSELPQLRTNDKPMFVKSLISKYGANVVTEGTKVKASQLKPIQNEINLKQVEVISNVSKGKMNPNKPITISQDGYVIDGHHRWYYAKQNDLKLSVLQINLNAMQVIDEIWQSGLARKEDISSVRMKQGGKI